MWWTSATVKHHQQENGTLQHSRLSRIYVWCEKPENVWKGIFMREMIRGENDEFLSSSFAWAGKLTSRAANI